MTYQNVHFVDPTIPGLSGRDLVERAVMSVRATSSVAGNAYRTARRDYAIRRGLARLDRHLLRDLGIDRDRA